MSDSDGKKNVHENHRDRMRERFSKDGFDNYRPHEVLEQLLFGIRPRVNTNPIGHDLIDGFGSVMNVLDAESEELSKINGVGGRSAEYIVSVKPRISRLICEQYRKMEKVTREMTAFLADWFEVNKSGKAGVIVCDKDGVFREWHEMVIAIDADGCFDCEKAGDELTGVVGAGKYILVFGEKEEVSRSSVYRLLDHTAKVGCVMSDAYRMDGFKPVSIIFIEREKEPYAPRFKKPQKR